jgi:hypothetical protein
VNDLFAVMPIAELSPNISQKFKNFQSLSGATDLQSVNGVVLVMIR